MHALGCEPEAARRASVRPLEHSTSHVTVRGATGSEGRSVPRRGPHTQPPRSEPDKRRTRAVLVPDTQRDMRLVNTVLRYESSARPWRRLLEIAADHFPDTLADLTLLQSRGVKLEMHVSDDRASYLVKLVGPDVQVVETDRNAKGRTSLSEPLAALSADSQEHEAAEGRKLAREVAIGALTLRYARSRCEGFGFESFDGELARYQAEIAQSKEARKQSR